MASFRPSPFAISNLRCELSNLGELIERLEDEIDIREATKALKEAKAKGTVPWVDVKRELGL